MQRKRCNGMGLTLLRLRLFLFFLFGLGLAGRPTRGTQHFFQGLLGFGEIFRC